MKRNTVPLLLACVVCCSPPPEYVVRLDTPEDAALDADSGSADAVDVVDVETRRDVGDVSADSLPIDTSTDARVDADTVEDVPIPDVSVDSDPDLVPDSGDDVDADFDTADGGPAVVTCWFATESDGAAGPHDGEIDARNWLSEARDGAGRIVEVQAFQDLRDNLTRHQRTEYDDSGLPERSVETRWNLLDEGSLSQRTTSWFEGELLLREEIDLRVDGRLDRVNLFSYDADENLVREEEHWELPADDSPHVWRTYSHDERGRVSEELRYTAAGLSSSYQFGYDELDNQVWELWDEDGDLEPDWRIERAYDERGNRVSEHTDIGIDGTIDGIATMSYDELDRLVYSSLDRGGEGELDVEWWITIDCDSED